MNCSIERMKCIYGDKTLELVAESNQRTSGEVRPRLAIFWGSDIRQIRKKKCYLHISLFVAG